jgi:hypothetical protein
MAELIHQYDLSGDGACPVHNSDCRVYRTGKRTMHVKSLDARCDELLHEYVMREFPKWLNKQSVFER